MNEMLERLDQWQRQFSADVSPELRSPLSPLRTGAEVIPRSPESAAGLADEIVASSSRMDRIIDDILRLAAEDAATVSGEEFDLPSPCRAVQDRPHAARRPPLIAHM